MKPYRSMLFVPGHKPSWVAKGIASGADALILDLEDSVTIGDKAAARRTVAGSIADVAAQDPGVGVWVRPNSWESGLAGSDLDAVVVDGLHGLFLPKVYTATDVLRFDTLLTHFEVQRGLAAGEIELLVSLETASSMESCADIARASSRVVSMLGATARDADIARALGYRYTDDGLETLYLRSRIVLACRAAGLNHPICGLWQDIGDIDGLVSFATQNRQLGYRGQVIIHPAHAQPVNSVFTPSDEEIQFYRGMITAFDLGEARGDAAVDYEGQHIDYAHVKTAREIVGLADAVRPTDQGRPKE
jgi:citrate lyase subunit beta/citryl-CoA lyase